MLDKFSNYHSAFNFLNLDLLRLSNKFFSTKIEDENTKKEPKGALNFWERCVCTGMIARGESTLSSKYVKWFGHFLEIDMCSKSKDIDRTYISLTPRGEKACILNAY